MDAALLKRAESAVARAREIAEISKRGIWGSSAGKAKVARRIAALLPAHKTYVEPFVGSGAVLFVKEQSDREIINDLDPDIAKAFRIIKSLRESDIDRLAKKTWVGSRKVYDALRKATPTDRVEWLYKFLYESRFSYRKIRGQGFDGTYEGTQANTIKRLRDRIDRLKGVDVHSGDYKSIVSSFDGPDTVFFFDPPYVGYDGGVGERKFNEDEFFEVLKRVKGKFVLTYGKKGKLPSLLRSHSQFKVRDFPVSGALHKHVDLVVTNFNAKFIAKNLSDRQRKEFERESEVIRENRKSPDNQKSHRFEAAEWTHPNGHPRCIRCGSEESVSGRCHDRKADNAAVRQMSAQRTKFQVEIHQEERLSKAVERLAGVVGMKVEQTEDHVISVPGADAIINGTSGLLIDSRKSHPVGVRLLLSGDNAFAHIELGKPKQIDLWKFAELNNEHGVTEQQRKDTWPKSRKLWAYPVVKAEPTDPSVIEIELSDDEAQHFEQAADLAVAWRDSVPGFVDRHKRFFSGDDLAMLENLKPIADEIHAVIPGGVSMTKGSAVAVGSDLLSKLQIVESKLPSSKSRDVVRRGIKAIAWLRDATAGQSFSPPSNDDDATPRLKGVKDLGQLEPIQIQPGAVTIIGSSARLARGDGSFDVLLNGVTKNDARRIGFDDARFIEAGDFGPVSDSVEVYDLVLVPRDDPGIIRSNVDKSDDPTLDIPSQRGKRSAAFQFQFKDDCLHGNLFMHVDDSLVGWSVANHNINKAHHVDDLKSARRMARRFEKSGNYYLKQWTDPRGIISEPTGRHPKAWLDVRNEHFSDGEFGDGIIVAVTEPSLHVEFGIQKSAVHEYLFTGDRSFSGRLVFKRSGDEWRSFWTESMLPIVLTKRAVDERIIPPQGYSAIPVSLEEVVPEPLRFWKMSGDESLSVRDALVSEQLFTDDNVAIVDGEFRRLTTKRFIDLGAARERKEHTPFALLKQEWRSSKGVTRKVWNLVIGGDDPRLIVSQLDPSCGDPSPCQMRTLKSLDLMSFEGDVLPGQEIGGELMNATRSTASVIKRVDRGIVDVIENNSELLKIRLRGRLRGELAIEPEESGSDLWVMRHASKGVVVGDSVNANLFAKRSDRFCYVECPACETINLRLTGTQKSVHGERMSVVECNDCGARFGVDVAVFNRDEIDDVLTSAAEQDDFGSYSILNAVRVKDGVQLWDGGETDPSVDKDQLRPLARYDAMKASKSSLTDFVTPTMLQLGVFVEPKLKGLRVSLQRRGNRVTVFDQQSTTIQTLIFSKDRFTREQAVQWAKDHDFHASKVDETSGSFRLRQRDPGEFGSGSMRTISLTDGVKAVIGRLKTAKADVSKSMTDLVKQIRSIPGNFVFDAVQTANGIEIIDALFVPSAGNIMSKSQRERRLKLEKLLANGPVHPVATRVVRNKQDLESALQWAAKQPCSVGAIVKSSDATYSIGSTSELWSTCDVERKEDPVHDLMQSAMAKKIPLVKTDEERFVLGIVLEPNDGENGAPLDPDTQQDIYSADEVRQAAHRYMEEHRNTGVMHSELANDRIKILESYIAPESFTIGGTEIRKGTWLLAVRIVDDDLWSKVKRGELTGFSIGGNALRAPEVAA